MNGMRYITKKKKLFSFLPIIFILMPRPPLKFSEFLVYPIMSLLLFLCVFLRVKKYNIYKNVFLYLLLFFLMFNVLAISSIINGLNEAAFSAISKVFFYIVIFLYGYTEINIFTIEEFKCSLLNSGSIILVIQILVSLSQLLGSKIFNGIYSMEKTLPLGTLVRVAGTLVNPNFFGWIIIQLAVIFFLFEKKKLYKLIKVLLCFILVFLSGSRNSLLIFPVAIFLSYLFYTKKSLKTYFFKLPLFLCVLAFLSYFVLSFLYKHQETFPYMSQLFNIFDSGSLTSVNSFSYRVSMWQDSMNLFKDAPGFSKYLFGLGPGTIQVVDNDYLYALINYGIFYCILQSVIYFKGVLSLRRIRNKQFFSLCIQYLILSAIIGLQSETFSGWNYPVLILYYIGFGCAFYEKMKGEN